MRATLRCAREALLNERQTAANLLAGWPWACWGPPVERAHLGDAVLLRIARRVRLPIDEVAGLMEEEQRGRYLLLEQPSVTKHAAVYAGFDPVLARDVVVKIHRDRQENATERAGSTHSFVARGARPSGLDPLLYR